MSAATDAVPELSVVIASHDASRVIARCLEALERQPERARLQVVVADSSTDGTAALVSARFPTVELLHSPAPLTVPELRARGIAAARAPVIAILDPYSIAAPDWAGRVLAAHRVRTNAVIGGTVGLDAPLRSSWARRVTYFNEYGLFAPPVARGVATIVPGSNVSYKRSALFDGERARYPVFWKTFANWDAERGGSPLWLEPDVRVDLHKPVPYGDFLRTRFHHGRCFAGMRAAQWSAMARAWHALTAPLVAPLLLARWTAGVWRKPGQRLSYAATLPGQVPLFAWWAVGEFVGYLAGPGDAPRRLFY